MFTPQILVILGFLPLIRVPPNRGFWLGSLGWLLGSVSEAPTFREKSETRKPLGSVGETRTFGEEQTPAEVLWASSSYNFVSSMCFLNFCLGR